MRRDFLIQLAGKVEQDIALFLGQPIVLIRKASECFAGVRKILNFFSQGRFHTPLSVVQGSRSVLDPQMISQPSPLALSSFIHFPNCSSPPTLTLLLTDSPMVRRRGERRLVGEQETGIEEYFR